jgi:hypothetical protein
MDVKTKNNTKKSKTHRSINSIIAISEESPRLGFPNFIILVTPPFLSLKMIKIRLLKIDKMKIFYLYRGPRISNSFTRAGASRTTCPARRF